MNHDLGEFLRSRRARVRPDDVGLPGGGRRRVPGLRREELAMLAGVSVDYYMRLEQGRTPAVSDSVLDAVARVLRLDDTERAHLRNLVRPTPARRPAPQRVRPGLRRLLEMADDVPAFVMGRRADILAWNPLADALYGFGDLPPEDRNSARHTFLRPESRTFYRDWPTVAADMVAFLRLDAGRYPDDARLAALVGELSVKDETFRKLWAQHKVLEKTHGTKLMRHPVVGDLDLDYETLRPTGDPDVVLALYTARAGSPTEDRLKLLASWSAVPSGTPSEQQA
ncbi:helix-turn-helix domain-containing protein [Saccharothrix sp. 6-C]|uniref:Transcriptional regulator with XRE-family HTH domain n=1 Tax=Saccharothrix texasensis TaxID=103734 RepID=A0A3N1H6W1_9PSEU|nr:MULTISPECIES: helix-turn-helix transcriptional regulator [Saccharothrix]QQQ77345.1 helix-turn-helix domain-containing protein [Saccharothrix sp. 6-C]ROP38275.1 transcriptional regulator with XRE-family HTH domain [Saccharothrix texasensis]